MRTISSTRGPEPCSQRRKKTTMPIPESESESSTKKRKRDVEGIAPADEPLPPPPPLGTSSTKRPKKGSRPRIRHIYLKNDGSFRSYQPKFEKGTTVLAFTFRGIMVAVDHSSKSSMYPKNVVELNSNMLATISGGSEFLIHDLQKKCYRKEQKYGRKTKVNEALRWLRKTLASYKEKLSVGILIAVWNESERGLYRVNGGGKVVKKGLLGTGFGSEATCVVQEYFRPDIHSRRRKRDTSIEKAANLARRALCIGASRAPRNHVGDTVTVYHLGSDGCKKLTEDNMKKWMKVNLKGWPDEKYEIIGKGW